MDGSSTVSQSGNARYPGRGSVTLANPRPFWRSNGGFGSSSRHPPAWLEPRLAAPASASRTSHRPLRRLLLSAFPATSIPPSTSSPSTARRLPASQDKWHPRRVFAIAPAPAPAPVHAYHAGSAFSHFFARTMIISPCSRLHRTCPCMKRSYWENKADSRPPHLRGELETQHPTAMSCIVSIEGNGRSR
jgi:hypothetical protein